MSLFQMRRIETWDELTDALWHLERIVAWDKLWLYVFYETLKIMLKMINNASESM